MMRKYLPEALSPSTLRLFGSAEEGAVSRLGSSASGPGGVAAGVAELAAGVDSLVGLVGDVERGDGDDGLLRMLDDAELRRRVLVQFLRARGGNAAEAGVMLRRTLEWRKRVGIGTFVRKGEEFLGDERACFPICVMGAAQPVAYGLTRLLDKRCVEKGAFGKALVAFFERLYFERDYATDEIVVILDFRGWSVRRNAPVKLVRDGIQTLQDHYPERLGRVFLLNYPTAIRAAFAAVSPIIDAGAREKIVWVPGEAYAVLSKHASDKAIPTFLGGQLDPVFPPSWPDVAAEFASDSCR